MAYLGGHFDRHLSKFLAGAVFLSLALPAFGDTVFASGAGPLPVSAQDLTGTFVNEIQGSLGTDPNAVDVFAIDIIYPLTFSAITIYPGAFGLPDPELFLFDSQGMGVYFNDDITPANTQSCLPSQLALNPCPALASGLGPTASGTYFLAITRSGDGPIDALGNEIFTNVLTTDVVGPNAGAGAVAGWDNLSFTQPDYDLNNYDIVLQGATPEPSTWVLMAGAAWLALFLRRRLNVSARL